MPLGNASLLSGATPAPTDPHPHRAPANSEDLLLAEAGQRAASLLLQEDFSAQPSSRSPRRQAYDPACECCCSCKVPPKDRAPLSISST